VGVVIESDEFLVRSGRTHGLYTPVVVIVAILDGQVLTGPRLPRPAIVSAGMWVAALHGRSKPSYLLVTMEQ